MKKRHRAGRAFRLFLTEYPRPASVSYKLNPTCYPKIVTQQKFLLVDELTLSYF